MHEMRPSDKPDVSKPPPYPFGMPPIRLSAQFMHPELRIDKEQFYLKDYAPPMNKPAAPGPTNSRFLHPDNLFHGFFDLSNREKANMEEARRKGQDSWRFDGKDKVVEVFFKISLADLKSGTKATPMKDALQMAEEFEEIPADKSYLALDCHGVPLVVLYADAYKRAWGTDMGAYIVKTTTENIDRLARFVQPSRPKDQRRHKSYFDWIKESADQPWATGVGARSGLYYFGIWRETGHDTLGVLTSDMECRKSYAQAMIRALQLWCANITQTIDACFAGIDIQTRDAYREAYNRMADIGTKEASQTMPNDLFHFRALLINLLTEPHMDHKDWASGWAWLTPFGQFEQGLMCITLLKRRLNFQPGSVFGIRGDRLEHFTTKWYGTNRYSWVFAFHQTVKEKMG
jgi:hypothetical protein